MISNPKYRFISISILVLFLPVILLAGERAVVSLKDFSEKELKMAGFEIPRKTTFHIKALGGGGDYGWTYKSDEMFAYGWIINAVTRHVVWEMETDNTERAKDDRRFDDNVTLDQGSYEAYFTVPVFAYHTGFTHVVSNVDHRNQPLFGSEGKKGKGFFEFFGDWWSEDVQKEWDKRSRSWGMEIFVDETQASAIKTFTPPRAFPNTVLTSGKIGEQTFYKQGFSLPEPMTVFIYALGEGIKRDDLVDFGWILDAHTRERVWAMEWRNVKSAGGAKKNQLFEGDVSLEKGDYVLYYASDDSHSPLDWNSPPPYDPAHYGVTIVARSESDAKKFKLTDVEDFKNVILRMTRVGNEESRSEGFTLKRDSKVRVYAIGEKSNSRSLMADYGYIMDARTRARVWTMNLDKTSHAGGASKNRYADELVNLPKGSYIVTYNTDDSHAYDDWNSKPPFDAENYGITIMGVGDDFTPAIVGKFVQERDKNVIAQLVKVRDGENREERFRLDRTTRLRVYAMGEGQSREMVDYGWIEDAKTRNVVWEMTYSMTFHAGGGRKNRMVNTTIVLDKGEYVLHYMSDDSHCYDDWNVDPPDDPEFWGITLFRDEGPEPPQAPKPPEPPE